jgi:hypothetical protein
VPGSTLAAVDLEFVEKRRGRADRSSWTPFEPSKSFNSDWWNDPLQYSWDDAWFVQVLRDGDEVGRVRLEKPLSLAHYGVDPNLDSNALKIQLIEVSSTCRRLSIGTAIVRELETRNPDRTLVALSMEADDFWASLGWQRYDVPNEQGPRSSPLFVQR